MAVAYGRVFCDFQTGHTLIEKLFLVYQFCSSPIDKIYDASSLWFPFNLFCVLISRRCISSSANGHFQCLLLEKFVFWQCSLLIGSAPSLECQNLAVVQSVWAIPGPSSGCFMMTKCVRQHKVVKGGKLQKSESSLICVIIAEGSTNTSPVSTSILVHFYIPVSLQCIQHSRDIATSRFCFSVAPVILEIGQRC